MPNWKKLIVSGSDASLNSLTASNGFYGTASWAEYAVNTTGLSGGTNNYVALWSGTNTLTTSVINQTINQQFNQPSVDVNNLFDWYGYVDVFGAPFSTKNDLGANIITSTVDSLTFDTNLEYIIGIPFPWTWTSITLTDNLSNAVSIADPYYTDVSSIVFYSQSFDGTYYTVNYSSSTAPGVLLPSTVYSSVTTTTPVITIGGNVSVNNTINVTEDLSVTGWITGSLHGTASWADNTTNANYATNAGYTSTANYANSAGDTTQLNGQLSSYYLDASNINAGTLNNARLPADINVLSVTASFTGSLTGTASYANNSGTASYVTSSNVNGPHGANSVLSASSAVTASYVAGSIFKGTNVAATASYSLQAQDTVIKTSGTTIYSVNPAAGTNFTTTGSIILGASAGTNRSTSKDLILIGASAGTAAQIYPKLEGNIYIGGFAGAEAKDTQYNIAIGSTAGAYVQNSNYSVAIGGGTFFSASWSGLTNAVGTGAGAYAISSSYANFIGYQAGRKVVNADYCNLIGYNVGQSLDGINSIGSNNIIIGTNITLPNGRTNSINLGGVIFASNVYSSLFGNPYSGSANGLVGINVVAPDYTLDVNGTGNFRTGLIVSASSAPAALTLIPSHPLPGGVLGGLAVSGSHLYFNNGVSWVQVV